MLEPGRSYSVGNQYRYGFNGKENDNDVKGEGNQQDYGKRIYDPRLGRFLSVDPLIREYPHYTPYSFAGNTPIQAVDLDGAEELLLCHYNFLGYELFNTISNTHPSNRKVNKPGTYVEAKMSNTDVLEGFYERNYNNYTQAGIENEYAGGIKTDLPEVMKNRATEVLTNVKGEEETRTYISIHTTFPENVDIYFKSNTTIANNANQSQTDIDNLNLTAIALVKFPELSLEITGSADAVKANNMKLSKDRANSLKSYITNFLKTNAKQLNLSDADIESVGNRIKTIPKGAIPGTEKGNQAARKAHVEIKGKIDDAKDNYLRKNLPAFKQVK
jgi:RHS repeat-associated protein